MTTLQETLTLRPMPHPNRAVHQAGFPLDHPYVERCWTQILGPTSVLLLRRMPEMFRADRVPVVPVADLARSLGIGGVGHHSAMRRTLDRVVQFGFAAWAGPGELEVFTEAPALSSTQVERSSPSTRLAHDRLLGQHLDALASSTVDITVRTPVDRVPPTHALAR
jgi:hypothetical protein